MKSDDKIKFSAPQVAAFLSFNEALFIIAQKLFLFGPSIESLQMGPTMKTSS